MTSRRSTLPTEVCERTIDFLRKDPKSLHSCLLTCRAWVPRSIYHLYASVHLSTPARLAVFLQFLHSNPASARFVHCLSLGRDIDYSESAMQDNDDLMVMAANRLPRLLTSLREIRLTALPADMHPTFPRLLSRFKAATQLTLESTEFRSFNQFNQFILAFSNLKRLCLFNTTWEQPVPTPVNHLGQIYSRRSRPALEHVVKIHHFNNSSEAEYNMNWLRTTAMTSMLVELSVSLPSKSLIPAFNKLLSNCSSLRTLEVYWGDPIRREIGEYCIHSYWSPGYLLNTGLQRVLTCATSSPCATSAYMTLM